MDSRKSIAHFRGSFRQLMCYVYATAAVAGMGLVLFRFREGLNTSTVALLFLIPVLVTTTAWGLGPGILAAVLTFLSYNFFFLVPYYTFAVHQPQDILALIIFLIVAILISQLVGRAKTSLEAALAREQEATRLYELSMGLAGVNDLKEIAAVVSQKTAEAFSADRVQITVEKVQGENSVVIRTGQPEHDPDEPAAMTVPLESMRGYLGEIRLWRGKREFLPGEERLLRTFAAQGALALERATLAQAERRAQVLEESDRLKSALLSSVSHEFRTPLVTIRAATTSLLSKDVVWDSEARQDLLTAVDEEAEHLNQLVGNLLNMSKIEAGAMKPNRQWNVLAEIAEGVAARMRRALAHHPLRIDIPDDLPLAPVDYQQMEQVFTNLLSNSAKYAPEGTEIEVTAGLADTNNLLVRVTNQGPRLAAEHLERIFDKFYRITNADKITGTGLGLSICKGIVEAHGGRIWAENRPEGFTFLFTLPITLDGMRPPMMAEKELRDEESRFLSRADEGGEG